MKHVLTMKDAETDSIRQTLSQETFNESKCFDSEWSSSVEIRRQTANRSKIWVLQVCHITNPIYKLGNGLETHVISKYSVQNS